MALVPLTVPTSSEHSRYKIEGSARLLNCYAEPTGSDAKASWTSYAPSGLDLWATVQASGTLTGPAGVRAMLATDDYLYVVAGRKITAISALGVQTVVATLPGDGDVYLARNRRSPTPEVAVVSDGTMRIITGTSIAAVTDPDLPPPTSVSTLDGYFLVPTTFDRVWISGEDDGTTYSALDFGRAQRQPDNTLFVLGAERDAMVFGERSVEWWNNSPDGSGNFPFVPIASINLGCAGAKTIVQLDRAVSWIANDGTVRLQDGYSGQRISTHTVERAIGTATTTIYGFGWTDQETGHAFLAWTCGTWTWVYNLRTGKWHEMQSYKRTNWRGFNAVSWRGMSLIGDYEDGRIYQVRASVFSEGGDPIITDMVLPILHSAPYGIRLNAIYIDAVPGVGNDPDAHPLLMVSTSTDGGKTFGAARLIELGDTGQHIRRLKTYRFGSFGPTGCAVKISCSASVARAISGVYADVDQLSK
ncbi:MAG: hypothetical protein IPL32_18630 [Chloracidobacterium sp.]|nr:hypothetical protein [Chloracidobacterium sp.]